MELETGSSVSVTARPGRAEPCRNSLDTIKQPVSLAFSALSVFQLRTVNCQALGVWINQSSEDDSFNADVILEKNNHAFLHADVSSERIANVAVSTF